MFNSLPYYPYYVSDFDEDPKVLAMNLTEVGLYQLALNESWKRGSIPADPKELAVLIRRKPAEVCKAWPKVLPCWIPNCVPGRLVNPRQEKERDIAAKRSTVASEAGRKAASARWSSSEESDSDRSNERIDIRSESVSGSPSSVLQTLTTEAPSMRTRVTFEELTWKWNRQKGSKKPQKPIRMRAEEMWKSVNMSHDDVDAALSGYFSSAWGKDQGYPLIAFVKKPHSWVKEPEPEDDGSFLLWRAAYESTGASWIESDFDKALPIWNTHAPEDHAKAIERVTACDPAFIKSPRNYLSDREFDRKPRPEPKSKSESIMEQV